jgi:hypothetical protein
MYKKIQGVYDEVFFASPEEAFKINAKQNDGKVVMPFISVWRLPDFTINRPTINDPRIRIGAVYRVNDDMNSPTKNVRGVPVELRYQIDVYATKRQLCDGLTAELLLYLLEYPYVDINVEEWEGFVAQVAVNVSDSVTDNTSISEFEDSGRIYRLTIEVLISEAIIYRIDRFTKSVIEKVYVNILDIDTEDIYDEYEGVANVVIYREGEDTGESDDDSLIDK